MGDFQFLKGHGSYKKKESVVIFPEKYLTSNVLIYHMTYNVGSFKYNIVFLAKYTIMNKETLM